MPPDTRLAVLRGNPTPEELAALLIVLTSVCRAPDPQETPRAARGWGGPTAWNHPETATAPEAAGWQRTPAPTHERSTR